MYNEIINFIKKQYPEQDFVPLHAPVFVGNEKKFLNECIDSTFVSYVGEFVSRFEKMVVEYTGAKYAVAVSNGTLALHIALLLAGVREGDEVVSQALTFVATANAISYCRAKPLFVDSDKKYLGMSAEKLEDFLVKETFFKDDGFCYNKKSGKRVSACVPMHVFGHSVEIDKIIAICDRYNITVIEDAAESLGSYFKERHTGTFGRLAILSFNGNKTITTGSGGMILTDDEELAKRAKHLTTTAKVPHKWEFFHDEIGYNYRLNNLNAAVGCAQMENLDRYIENKRELASLYRDFFNSFSGIKFFSEPAGCRSNYWLNALILNDRQQRDTFLQVTNENGVMTRPIWQLMSRLPMFTDCYSSNLEIAEWLEERVVNIPSSVRL